MQIEQGILQGKRTQFARPRLPLAAQIFLWGLLALGLLFVVSSISTWLVISQQAYTQVQDNTENLLNSFDSQLKDDTNSLTSFGQWISRPDNASALANALNSPESTQTMEMLLAMADLDYMIATDAHGRVLGRAGFADPGKPGDDLSARPDIMAAIAGQTSMYAEFDASGRLAVSLITPVRPRKEGSIGGPTSDNSLSTVSLGFFIDAKYLKDIEKNSGQDIALVIISGDPLGSKMMAVRGSGPNLETLAGNLNVDNRAIRTGQLVTLMTDRGPYLFRFRAPATPLLSSAVLVGSGMRAAVLENQYQMWLKTFGVWFLIGVLALAAFGFLLSRSLATPLLQLSRSVQDMRQGKLTTEIKLDRGGELGELAVLLDGMRQELLQKWDTLTFEKNRVSAAMNSMSVPVVLTDAQNCIVTANCAAERLIGSSNPNLTGRAWNSLFALKGSDFKGSPALHTASPALDVDPPSTLRARLALNTGTQPILDISSAAIHVDGALVGYVHTLQDVSEMDRFAKAKNEFLLSVAHELEGPLASWRTSLDLLIEDYGRMTRHELGLMLRTLQKTAVRFQGLVEALVDMGKLEVGKFKIHPAPTSYDKLVKDSISQIEPALHNRGQELVVRIGTGPDCKVLADRPRISQVIINLIRNASKYSPEGEPIVVETRAVDGQVFFEVVDQGSGIDRSEQELIFERYYRSKRVEEEGAGIGLGLALSKAIIQAHGGEIGVSSELGQGSRFWFSLSKVVESDFHGRSGGTLETVGSR